MTASTTVPNTKVLFSTRTVTLLLLLLGSITIPTSYIPSCHCLSSLVAPTLPTQTARAPPWTELHRRLLDTKTGAQLSHEAELRQQGRGPPHIRATLRLFDDDEKCSNTTTKHVPLPLVTFYRDAAGWCPYCQKVWIALEEKRIPYQVKTVPLNAYGDKPAWYTRLVDGGKLPAVELNGELITESLQILQRLDSDFPVQNDNMVRLIPTEAESCDDFQRYKELLQLEQELQSAWFSLVFYPVEGATLDKARDTFLETLTRVNDALLLLGSSTTANNLWFLGGTTPSLVDIQFVTSLERILASVLYFKGIPLLQPPQPQQPTGTFGALEQWLHTWQQRPSYRATQSDMYTLIKSIPSQNGPGYSIPQAKEIAQKIDGLHGAWNLPLTPLLLGAGVGAANEDQQQQLQQQQQQQSYRHEAAYCLILNHDAIVTFSTRGAGAPGRPSFHAELADPYAEPNDAYCDAVDVCLRHITDALLQGVNEVESLATLDMAGHAGDGTLRPNWYEYPEEDQPQEQQLPPLNHNDSTNRNNGVYWWNEETGDSTWTPPTMQLDTCLAYLRDRIGVPRDMSEGAAMQLRAHLNWAIDILNRPRLE
jgi:glutathione S-transferase